MRIQARAKRGTTDTSGAPNGVPSTPLPISDADSVPASTLSDGQVPARVKLPSVSRPSPSAAAEPSCQLLTDKVDGSDSNWNPWKDVPLRWHTTGGEESLGEEECWSDSNETSDSHHQPSSQYFTHAVQTNMLIDGPAPAKCVARSSKSYLHSPPLCPQRAADPVQLRHPRPKTTELCRNWLRNKCNRGYSCHYIHEDLEYDDDPVGVTCFFTAMIPQVVT